MLSLGAELASAAGVGLTVAVIGSDAGRFAPELQAAGVSEVLTVPTPTEH